MRSKGRASQAEVLQAPSLRIAVVADTHDFFPDSVAREIARADEIWHLGDVCRPAILERIQRLGPPVLVVRGNNDFLQPWPLELTLTRSRHTFRLIHIPPMLSKLGKSDFLLHGHTHVPRDEMIGGIRILNPGTLGKPNKGALPSYAWLTIHPEASISWEIVPVG
jgi:hypothetical protein